MGQRKWSWRVGAAAALAAAHGAAAYSFVPRSASLAARALPSSGLISSQGGRGRAAPKMVFDKPSDAESEHNAKQVKNLLTQQSLASVTYYWMEFRDDLTPKWLAGHTEQHGGVDKVGWAKFLMRLMRTEPEELVVRRVTQKPRGGSGNNPYLASNRHAMEYTVLIEPLAIAKKVMTVREQIAAEWSADLDLVEAENHELMRHHDDTVSLVKEAAERARQMVFDHDPYGSNNTPYRGKNYRQLLELVTATAIRRYESEMRVRGDRYKLNWLEKFLHRHGTDNKGNALLEAMLQGTMVMINDPRRDKPRVIEPTEVAQSIMRLRLAVAKELAATLAGTADEHVEMRRALLEFQLKQQMDSQVLTEHRRRIVEASPPSGGAVGGGSGGGGGSLGGLGLSPDEDSFGA